MKCPLREVSVYDKESVHHWEQADCLKEDCAWWSKEMNQCDPTGLLPWLKNIEGYLEELKLKMPVASPFGKYALLKCSK